MLITLTSVLSERLFSFTECAVNRQQLPVSPQTVSIQLFTLFGWTALTNCVSLQELSADEWKTVFLVDLWCLDFNQN